MAIFFVIAAIGMVSGTVSFFSNLTLIQTLREQYPDYYKLAGRPTIAALVLSPDINFHWGVFLLNRRYASLPQTPPALLGTFQVAFWSSWLHIVTLALLLAWVAWFALS